MEDFLEKVQDFLEKIPFTTSGSNFEDNVDHSFGTITGLAVICVASWFLILVKIGCGTTFPSGGPFLPWNYTSLRLVGMHVLFFGLSCGTSAAARYMVDLHTPAGSDAAPAVIAPAAAAPAAAAPAAAAPALRLLAAMESDARDQAVDERLGTVGFWFWFVHCVTMALSSGALFMAALAFPDSTYPFPSNYSCVLVATVVLVGSAIYYLLSPGVDSGQKIMLNLALPVFHILAAVVGLISGAMFTAPNFATGCFFTLAAFGVCFTAMIGFPSCSDPDLLEKECPFPKNFNHEACMNVVFLVAMYFFARTKRPHENLERSRTNPGTTGSSGFYPLRPTRSGYE